MPNIREWCIVITEKYFYSFRIRKGVFLIIEVECYRGDTLLRGKKISFPVFTAQIAEIERDYDRNEDNFITLLCRRYHYEIISTDTMDAVAEFVYDRDTEKTYQRH